MEIARDDYLQKLDKVRENGLVKIITGVRRCGKSYLLFTLYRSFLRRKGVTDDHIVSVQLDDDEAVELRDPRKLSAWIKERLPKDGTPTYVFIDEIQMCKPDEGAPKPIVTFYDVLNSLMKKPGVDVYVTGSNSEMLSKDVATNFRDRGVEVRVWPLGFDEYLPVSGMEKTEAWDRYLTWGGMPLCVLAHDDRARRTYLNTLFQRIYLKDIVERYSLTDDGTMLSAVVDIRQSYESAKACRFVAVRLWREDQWSDGCQIHWSPCRLFSLQQGRALGCQGKEIPFLSVKILFGRSRASQCAVEFSTGGAFAPDGKRHLQ